MSASPASADPHPAQGLLADRPLCLADWYGDPLRRAHARELLQLAERALQLRLRRCESCFPLHLLLLICSHWLGADSGLQYRQLGATAGDGRALLELVYGQLLISRKLRRGMAHLERGFGLAARRLESDDYFRLLRRHEALLDLPLGEAPFPPQPLARLLAEAAVIRCLRGSGACRYDAAHRDTIG